jgi:hypothetical protein
MHGGPFLRGSGVTECRVPVTGRRDGGGADGAPMQSGGESRAVWRIVKPSGAGDGPKALRSSRAPTPRRMPPQ